MHLVAILAQQTTHVDEAVDWGQVLPVVVPVVVAVFLFAAWVIRRLDQSDKDHSEQHGRIYAHMDRIEEKNDEQHEAAQEARLLMHQDLSQRIHNVDLKVEHVKGEVSVLVDRQSKRSPDEIARVERHFKPRSESGQ